MKKLIVRQKLNLILNEIIGISESEEDLINQKINLMMKILEQETKEVIGNLLVLLPSTHLKKFF